MNKNERKYIEKQNLNAVLTIVLIISLLMVIFI